LTDLKLGMGLVIKAEGDWQDVGRSQVAMHRNFYILSISSFFAL